MGLAMACQILISLWDMWIGSLNILAGRPVKPVLVK
jgi:hypothetical protein